MFLYVLEKDLLMKTLLWNFLLLSLLSPSEFPVTFLGRVWIFSGTR